MDGLGAQLKSLKRASLPLQTHLELPFALAERRTRAARALPPPLYVLYTQLAAAKEAFAEDIDVSIEGSIADAEAFARREAAAREKKEKVSERGDGGVSTEASSPGPSWRMATTRTASARANARAHPRARARMATIPTRRILFPWCWSWVRARRRVRFGITSRYASSRARRARPSTRISSSISSRTTTGRSRRTPRTRSDGAGSDGTPTDAAASDRFGGVNISPAWISSPRRRARDWRRRCTKGWRRIRDRRACVTSSRRYARG